MVTDRSLRWPGARVVLDTKWGDSSPMLGAEARPTNTSTHADPLVRPWFLTGTETWGLPPDPVQPSWIGPSTTKSIGIAVRSHCPMLGLALPSLSKPPVPKVTT